MSADPDSKTASRLLERINASWMTQALCVAAELRLADLIGGGMTTARQLAVATGCDRGSLARLLRALASLEIVRERSDQSYALTPMGRMLRADTPQSLRSWAIWWGRHQWGEWEELRYSVRTGASARAMLAGRADGVYQDADPQLTKVFHRAMSELTRVVAIEVLRQVDFSNVRSITDIGGGRGDLLAAILRAHPDAQGTLLDLPNALADAHTVMARNGVEHRCRLAGGDFFSSIPAGADVYLLKSVLHNWENDRCRLLLSNCRAAMSASARLIVIERVLPQRMRGSARDRAAARSDLNMLVGIGGRERNEREIDDLLRSAGLRPGHQKPATSDFGIVQAVAEQHAEP